MAVGELLEAAGATCHLGIRVEVSIGSATTWDDSSGRRSWIPGFGRSIRCGRSGQGHPEDHPGRVNGAMLKIGNLGTSSEGNTFFFTELWWF